MITVIYIWNGSPIQLPQHGNLIVYWNGIRQLEGVDYYINQSIGGGRQLNYPAVVGGLVPNIGDKLVVDYGN